MPKRRYKDIEIGDSFGRLIVVTRLPRLPYEDLFWRCSCSCGKMTIVVDQSLKSGGTKSCGCLRVEVTQERTTTHGHTSKLRSKTGSTPEYEAWKQMIGRCYGTYTASYKTHGARGIRVCDDWRHSFGAFLIYMGLKPSPELTLERINNNGNYEPGNVKWATKKEQARNRRTNRLITVNGVTKCLQEWSEDSGVSHTLILYRLRAGWGEEELLTAPDLRRKRHEYNTCICS